MTTSFFFRNTSEKKHLAQTKACCMNIKGISLCVMSELETEDLADSEQWLGIKYCQVLNQ
jgi:hypothetical protein